MKGINEIINEVYEDAVACDYPRTPRRDAAIKEIIPLVEGYDLVWDFCPQEMELVDAVDCVKPLVPNPDMHEFLDKLCPLDAELVVARHVLEHSIMPYVLLKLLKKHSKRVLVIVPENSAYMVNYRNHFSVFDRKGWENLFKKAGFKFEFKGEAVFQGTGAKEWRYLLTQ